MSDLSDPLAGVSEKSTKAELWARIQDMAKFFRTVQDDRVAHVQQIESDLRQKWKDKNQTDPVSVLIVTATDAEYAEATEYLADQEDMPLPMMLQRLLAGARVKLQEKT